MKPLVVPDTGVVPVRNLPTYLQPGAIADQRIAVYEVPFGDGTVGPFQINHGQNSRSFSATVRRVVTPFDLIDTPYIEAPSPNFIIIRPDVAVPAGQYVIGLTFRLGVADVTPPSKPTISLVSKSQNSVTMSGAATDDVGVVNYNWFRDGTYLGTSFGSAPFTATGLTPATTYSGFTCTALDAAGNESTPSNALAPVTTDATTAVTFDAVGAGGRAANANSCQWTHQVGTGANRVLIAFGTRSLSAWTPASDYTASIVSDKDGALQFVDVIDIGPSGQEAGSIRMYYKLNPTPGQHVLTYSDVRAGTTNAHTQGDSVSYAGVAAVTGVVKTRPTAAAAMSLTVASALNEIAVCGAIYETGNPTGYNKTPRRCAGRRRRGPRRHPGDLRVGGCSHVGHVQHDQQPVPRRDRRPTHEGSVT